MQIQVLLENTAVSEQFRAEHGLSLRIESEGKTMLFDMGQSEAFAINAETLGLSLTTVQAAILSHGHYDHGGGLQTFLERTASAPVWLAASAFERHINAVRGADIGLNPALASHSRLHFVSQDTEILPGVSVVFPPSAPVYPVMPYGLEAEHNGVRGPETFTHELYLLINDHGRRVLFSGCAHRGILNLMNWFRPDIYVGGFHLKPLNPALPDALRTLEAVGEALAAYPCLYLTGHCTGDAAYALLSDYLGDRLRRLSGGAIFDL